ASMPALQNDGHSWGRRMTLRFNSAASLRRQPMSGLKAGIPAMFATSWKYAHRKGERQKEGIRFEAAQIDGKSQAGAGFAAQGAPVVADNGDVREEMLCSLGCVWNRADFELGIRHRALNATSNERGQGE